MGLRVPNPVSEPETGVFFLTARHGGFFQRARGTWREAMVTRKVARSKRDAIAIAEAQRRESEPEPEDKPAGKGKGTRRGRGAVAPEPALPTRGSKGKGKARAREAERDPSPPRRGAAAAKGRAAKAAEAKAAVESKAKRRGGSAAKDEDSDDESEEETKASATEKAAAAKQSALDNVAVQVPTGVGTPTAATGAGTPRSISTRNGGSRRVTPVATSKKPGVSESSLLREQLEYKVDQLDPAIKARFGQLIWARRAAFPFWPALILDPRLLPDHQLPNAVKELDEKCWVQLYGSRDIRQILFTALAPWDDKSHPYREGYPRSDFHRLTKLQDTFTVALQEASEQEKLTPEQRLKIFTTEVVPSLGAPVPPAQAGVRKRRKMGTLIKTTKPDTPVSQGTIPLSSTPTEGPNSSGHAATTNSRPDAAESLQNLTTLSSLAVHDSEDPESRYRLGPLRAYVSRLRTVLGRDVPEREWRVQLLLSQLLDEKAFLRRDLEEAQVWEVVDLLRESENTRWRDLAETVRTHLNNCTLEVWPSTRKPPAQDRGLPKRPASTPLLGLATSTSPESKRQRTNELNLTSRARSDEMAEIVARSFIQHPTPQSAISSGHGVANSTNSHLPPASNSGVPATPLPVVIPGVGRPVSAPGNRVVSASSTSMPHRQIPSPRPGRINPLTHSAAPPLAATAPGISNLAPTPQPVFGRTNPSLVIFNKDGTLLDFQTTWTSWIESQVWRLETALGRQIREPFFEAIGYNIKNRTMRKGGIFNTYPKHELGPKFAIDFLIKLGLPHMEAVRIVNQHWSLPKEVATFRARRDLHSLFKSIQELGVKIAILTSDRRDITVKTLTRLGVAHMVDGTSCGDEGMSNSPERIWALCSRLGVSTANTVLVGDTADDMTLGRSAGCALSVGVMGGAADLSELSGEADFLVPCTSNIVKLLFQYRQQAAM